MALTFHGAGPAALARQLLAEAERAGVQVTVLAVGRWLAADPAMARRILDGGHELGNHTYTHPVLPRLAAGAVFAEITRCRDVLVRQTGSAGRWFRPSGTPTVSPMVRALAARAGYACLGYDVDPRDFADPGPAAVLERTMRAVRPGSVVSLHLGHAGTVAALPGILDALHRRGLRPVVASALPRFAVTARRAVLGALLALAAACSSTSASRTGAAAPAKPAEAPAATPAGAPGAPSPVAAARGLLPGMPAPLSPVDVYAADRPGALSPRVRADRPLVYVPNSGSGSVEVLDPRTYRVVSTFGVGRLPQHVVPSYDLRTLWVNNDLGNSLTPIDPRTGRPGRPVPVEDPYNLYFTPDGRHALVMAEARRRIDVRDPHTMRLQRSVPVPCAGVNHADFSADGRQFVATCEFSSQLLLLDTASQRVLARMTLPHGAMPQDVKLSPDGRTYYVADMQTSGVWTIDAATFRRTGFVPTGPGAHGLYVSRDSRVLYVANRGGGSVSVLSFRTGRVVRTWHLPGGGSPDMGGVSADGRVLWLSGRYSREVYAIDVVHWRLLKRIPVGAEPHGLCVWPQPGRYSLGHTGTMR